MDSCLRRNGNGGMATREIPDTVEINQQLSSFFFT